MKDSGIEWLGTVPEHWDVVTLRRTLRPFDGIKIGPFGSQLKLEHMSPSGYKVYGQANVIATDFTRGTKFVSRKKFAELSACQVLPGDLLVTMMGTSGRCAYVPNGVASGIMDSHLLRLRTSLNIDVKFASLLIDKSPYVKEQIAVAGKGSIMHGLNSGMIKNFVLALPPVSEQTAIVRFLDHADRRIRRYIRTKERLIELLEEQKQAIIHQAVTGQIDVRTGQPYPAYRDSGVEWLGMVPTHWDVCTLGRISESFRTGPFGSMLHQSDYVEDGTPVINPIHMNNGAIIEDPSCSVPKTVAEKLSSYRLCLHDLIFARRGELGRCAIVRSREVGWLCGTGSIRVRIERKRILAKFLIQTLQVWWVGEYLSLSSVGATMDNLNTSILKGVPLLVPPIQLQKDIVEHIGQRTTTIAYAIRRCEEEVCLIRQFRTRLIADVVTGKLDVRETAAELAAADPIADDDGVDIIQTESDSHISEYNIANEAN